MININKTIQVEGWRGINHSYSMVNQYQLLELVKRDGINIFHKDLPLYKSDWNHDKNSNGMDLVNNETINSIKESPSKKPDITYRIAFPYRLYGADTDKVFCFGTAEYQNIEGYIYQGWENSKIYINNDVKIITPSNWSKKGFLHHGFKNEDVFVVPHGVDINIFKPIDSSQRALERKALKLEEQNFTFLTIGAMTWNKGIDKLLLAFSEINKKYPHTRLILKDQKNLYGIGAFEIFSGMHKDHSSLFSEQFLSSINILSANLNLNQLASLYNSCDAYIAPYRAEGFNLPPLEAAACGAPVAITSGGSTDDYFNESFALKIEGKITSKGSKKYIEPDLESLINVMTGLVEKRNLSLNRSFALNYICDNFTWEKVTDKLLNIFFM